MRGVVVWYMTREADRDVEGGAIVIIALFVTLARTHILGSGELNNGIFLLFFILHEILHGG